MSFLLSALRGVARAPLSSTHSTAALTRSFATTPPPQLARLTVVGRLGADPEVTTTKTGTEIVKYVVGTSYGPRENRQTSWFRVASFLEKDHPIRDRIMSMSKGTLVYLEGDATMRNYDDNEGKRQSQLSLVQTRLEVLKRPSPVVSETPVESEQTP